MIVPMPASMSINRFFLPEVVFFGAPVGSYLANLSRVARIEAISVSANLDFLPLFTYRLGTVNSNTVNSKFHLIRSCCEYLARFLSFHV